MSEPIQIKVFEKSCNGCGECFRQTDNNSYEKDPDISCLKNCQLSGCPTCQLKFPQWIKDAGQGQCLSCATFEISYGKKWNKGIDCLHCGKKLRPIGTARANGKKHNDWSTRQYHKKCWIKVQRKK